MKDLLKKYVVDNGWYIFPCKQKDKIPLTEHGFHDSSNDIAQIEVWENVYPNCNWGVDLGKTQLAVIDIDIRNGGNFKEEPDFFIISSGENNKEYRVQKTLLAKTGGGGYHLYYAGSRKLPAKLSLGIDMKSEGGYVILPPSIHYTGGAYEWINTLDIAPFPDALLQEISTKQKAQPTLYIPDKIQYGERNNTLFKLGCSLRGRGFETSQILANLLETNLRCIPPLSENEIEAIVKQAMQYEPNEIGNLREKEQTLSDSGNSDRFIRFYKDNVRYCNELKTWFIWNGKYWEKDTTLEIQNLAKELVKNIYFEATLSEDRELQSKIAAWTKTSGNESKIDAMLDLAKSGLPIRPKDLDSNIYLLNLKNGVLDLKSGELLAHDPHYYFTQIVDIEYNPGKGCDNWKGFLDLVFPNNDVQNYIQRCVGYSLTGCVDEQCFYFCYGKGANGKSTFIEAVSKLFGDLAQKTDADSLMGFSSGATPYKARMRGKRFIVSSEIPEGKKWNETLMKDLTGGEMIVARDVYQTPYEFKPTFKIWITGNHKPNVQDYSLGFWRRIKLIDFPTTIPQQDRKPMQQVLGSFDYSAILNWAIEGCRLWQKEGLKEPSIVIKSTDEYRKEEDILQNFIDEKCIISTEKRIQKSDFRTTFSKYVKDYGYKEEYSAKKLTSMLTDKGIAVGGNGRGEYFGISINQY